MNIHKNVVYFLVLLSTGRGHKQCFGWRDNAALSNPTHLKQNRGYTGKLSQGFYTQILSGILHVQEVVPILYINMLYKMGHYFLDTEYKSLEG